MVGETCMPKTLIQNFDRLESALQGALTFETKEAKCFVTLGAKADGVRLFFNAEELTHFDELIVSIENQDSTLFLPIESATASLKISIKTIPAARLVLFTRFEKSARDVELTLDLGEKSSTAFYTSLDESHSAFHTNATIRERAEAYFTGLLRTSMDIVTDVEVNVHHTEGLNKTDQKFYSYAKDTSAIRFMGRIVVDPGASGTEAHQLHRGVLLSRGARINAQPFLNISHDDVRCTHGSTVGFIDESALAYLMARSLSREDAEAMLIQSSERQFYDALPNSDAQEFYSYKESEL